MTEKPKFDTRMEQLLVRWRDGDRAARAALVTSLLDRLRTVAKRALRHFPGIQASLSETVLVNEVYLRIDALIQSGSVANADHLMALANQVAQGIAIDHVRRLDRFEALMSPSELERAGPAASRTQEDRRLDLEQAMARFRERYPRQAEIVARHYLDDTTIEDIAKQLFIGTATVKRDLTFARSWFVRALSAGVPPVT